MIRPSLPVALPCRCQHSANKRCGVRKICATFTRQCAPVVGSAAAETPKPGSAAFAAQQTHIIASNQRALQAAAQMAKRAGLNPYILSDSMEGEARDVGQVHAATGLANLA